MRRPEGQESGTPTPGSVHLRGKIILKIKASFIEIYLTYNKLYIFQVYNLVKFWHMYISGTHHHNQSNKHIHHPINSLGALFLEGFPVEDSLEGCNFCYGH